MRTLNLADNLLEELLPRLFQQLTKLKSLDLSGNPIEDLTPDVFRDIMVRNYKWKFTYLFVNHNLLQDLRVLKCRRCGLKKVNPHLYHLLGQLTELDLGDNQVIYLIIE